MIDIPSFKELINSFNQFCRFSGLKAKIEKCEIAGIRSLKGAIKSVCGLKCIDLSNGTIKILQMHFSFNKKVQMQNNFITTIKNAATSSLFVEFTYAYPWGKNYDI